MLGIWYEYAGVRRGRSVEGKSIRWNWDGIRPGEARWVLRMEIGALKGTGRRNIENKTLGRSGHTRQRGRTPQTRRTYAAQGADTPVQTRRLCLRSKCCFC